MRNGTAPASGPQTTMAALTVRLCAVLLTAGIATGPVRAQTGISDGPGGSVTDRGTPAFAAPVGRDDDVNWPYAETPEAREGDLASDDIGSPGDDFLGDDDGPGPGETAFDRARLALLPVLRVGLVLDPASEDFRVAEPFRAALEAGLRIPVHLVAYRDLSRLQGALIRGEIDYAPLSASAYAAAYRRCSCVMPLFVPRSADGAAGWHAVALVAKGAPFRTLKDLAGARLATARPVSTAGYRVPLAAMKAEGLDPDRDFASVRAFDSPRAAAAAVLAGEADVAFGWSSLRGDARTGYSRGTLRDLAELRGEGAPALRIVWTSPQIPNAPHVVHDSVPVEIRHALVELLVRDAAVSPRDALKVSPHGFVPVTHEDFAPVLATFAESGNGARGRLRPLGGAAGELR
ncbi:phosphate/phosphite/phosphonate ABC transporter substrate-binding protein [Stappia sp. ES.058]|uniref:phosphate/phosphite/phosphonate ABC transporter substrate-binding protein n=1 Tax=Stappia sp. ES.058 TaxID=1881061 RepID=UPI0008792D89|nr:phosphate/phosphite/phosphonate ABC transporter substrate-binding protein [Stappia sp. ES.058]SDT88827.1 phosphate/phosphite/phosphonate ABC transporter binding protein [Stappia sp. ES.058]